MRHSLRDKTGRFMSRPKNLPIISGRLYGYRGTIVRAGQKLPNGKRYVSYHKQLNGFVDEQELKWLDKNQVAQYLQTA